MHGWMDEQGVVGIAAVQKGMIYGTDTATSSMRRALPGSDARDRDLGSGGGERRSGDPSGRGSGIVGVRYFPINVADIVSWISSENSVAMWGLCNELRLLVDLEGPTSNSEALIPGDESMADRFSNTPVVLDHLFLPDVNRADYGIGHQFDGFCFPSNIYLKWTSLSMDVTREQGVAVANVLRRAVDFLRCGQDYVGLRHRDVVGNVPGD